jgi:hypothetical protein
VNVLQVIVRTVVHVVPVMKILKAQEHNHG